MRLFYVLLFSNILSKFWRVVNFYLIPENKVRDSKFDIIWPTCIGALILREIRECRVIPHVFGGTLNAVTLIRDDHSQDLCSVDELIELVVSLAKCVIKVICKVVMQTPRPMAPYSMHEQGSAFYAVTKTQGGLLSYSITMYMSPMMAYCSRTQVEHYNEQFWLTSQQKTYVIEVRQLHVNKRVSVSCARLYLQYIYLPSFVCLCVWVCVYLERSAACPEGVRTQGARPKAW